MNKSELIEKISEAADLSQTKAEAALNAATETISNAMKDGDTVALVFLTNSFRKHTTPWCEHMTMAWSERG